MPVQTRLHEPGAPAKVPRGAVERGMPDFETAPPLPRWLAPHLPFDRKIATLGSDRIHFVDHGEGRPVLMMHGNPTWSFLWRKVIGLLPGYRCVAPDLLGLGLSSKPLRSRAHQLERHVDAISKLVEALQLREFIVVGQDWGGPVAAGVGERLPDRVSGVVFANTAVVRPRRPLKTKAFHRFARAPVVSQLAFRVGGFPLQVLHTTQGDRRSIGRLERRAYRWPLRRFRDRAAPLGLARMVPSSESHPTTATMDRIGSWVEAWDGPAALVWGLRDPILGRGLRRHRECLPQARVWETQAGHFLQEEVPDPIAEAIRQVAEMAS